MSMMTTNGDERCRELGRGLWQWEAYCLTKRALKEYWVTFQGYHDAKGAMQSTKSIESSGRDHILLAPHTKQGLLASCFLLLYTHVLLSQPLPAQAEFPKVECYCGLVAAMFPQSVSKGPYTP